MRTIAGVVILALVAVLALRYGNVSERMLPKLDLPENSDYYLRKAVVRQMGETGKLEYRMDVAESLHYPDDTSRLTGIDVHYMGGEAQPGERPKGEWILHADRGLVPAGREEVLLQDNVRAVLKREGGDDVLIETAQAWVKPGADLIETRSRVVATTPGRRAEGTGMTVFLDQDSVKLHKDVKVRYAP